MKRKKRKKHGTERDSVKFSVEVILWERLQRFESLYELWGRVLLWWNFYTVSVKRDLSVFFCLRYPSRIKLKVYFLPNKQLPPVQFSIFFSLRTAIRIHVVREYSVISPPLDEIFREKFFQVKKFISYRLVLHSFLVFSLDSVSTSHTIISSRCARAAIFTKIINNEHAPPPQLSLFWHPVSISQFNAFVISIKFALRPKYENLGFSRFLHTHVLIAYIYNVCLSTTKLCRRGF